VRAKDGDAWTRGGPLSPRCADRRAPATNKLLSGALGLTSPADGRSCLAVGEPQPRLAGADRSGQGRMGRFGPTRRVKDPPLPVRGGSAPADEGRTGRAGNASLDLHARALGIEVSARRPISAGEAAGCRKPLVALRRLARRGSGRWTSRFEVASGAPGRLTLDLGRGVPNPRSRLHRVAAPEAVAEVRKELPSPTPKRGPLPAAGGADSTRHFGGLRSSGRRPIEEARSARARQGDHDLPHPRAQRGHGPIRFACSGAASAGDAPSEAASRDDRSPPRRVGAPGGAVDETGRAGRSHDYTPQARLIGAERQPPGESRSPSSSIRGAVVRPACRSHVAPAPAGHPAHPWGRV
jgi:hypothetical protein